VHGTNTILITKFTEFRNQTASGLFWDITQRTVANPYGRFGTTYLSNLQESRDFYLDFLTIGVGTDRLSETSIRNYHYTLRNDPEERRSQLLRSGSLRSQKKTS